MTVETGPVFGPGPGFAPAGGYKGGAKHMSAKGLEAVRSEGAKGCFSGHLLHRIKKTLGQENHSWMSAARCW